VSRHVNPGAAVWRLGRPPHPDHSEHGLRRHVTTIAPDYYVEALECRCIVLQTPTASVLLSEAAWNAGVVEMAERVSETA
jgi:hypothetical protein